MDGVDAWLQAIAASPWALPAMAVLVFADAFLVVVPGEAAVTAFGALAAAHGTPSLAAVILVAGAAAFAGDLGCYLVGRAVGVERWAWMRGPRVSAPWSGRVGVSSAMPRSCCSPRVSCRSRGSR